MRQYITANTTEYNTIDNHVSAPLFRRIFSPVPKGHSVLEISSAGLYRVFLNRKELTKGFFAPYISNTDQVVYYDEYELEELSDTSDNELLVLLGNGFQNANDGGVWGFENAPFRSAPKFYLSLKVDGEEILTTDTSFEVFDSPITFDDMRCGEWYDARLEKNLFQSSYPALLTDAPKGEYKRCGAQPILAHESYAPQEIFESGEGYLYDFGENHTGLCRLHICAEEGQELTFTYGELRSGNHIEMKNISFGSWTPGYIQCDHYICKKGTQEYIPSFTYHGFRYVYVTGITPEQATKSLLTCVDIHSDIMRRASFSCDHPILNRIQRSVLRSDTSNFHYFPTDCPHREKNGWTGDIAASAEQICYNFDAYDSFREWLHTVRAAQLEDGMIPGIIPTSGWGYAWGNGMIWDSVLVELPYQLYRFFGRREIVEENADAIWKYLNYMKTRVNQDGLLEYGLGDWCECGAPREDICKTPLEISASLMGVDFLRKAAELFSVIGQTERRDSALQLEAELRSAFQKKHIQNNLVSCESQTAQSMALSLGFFTGEEEKSAYDYLKQMIERDGGHMCVGMLGARYLFDVLSEHGDSDLALKLVEGPDYPSYGYMALKGAGTLWEAIREYHITDGTYVRADGMDSIGSLNHHYWGSVSAWFYQRLAGIRLISAKQVRIAPCTDCGLGMAEADFRNEFGSIRIKWEKTSEGIRLQIQNRGFRGVICQDDCETPLQEGEMKLIYDKLRKREDGQ